MNGVFNILTEKELDTIYHKSSYLDHDGIIRNHNKYGGDYCNSGHYMFLYAFLRELNAENYLHTFSNKTLQHVLNKNGLLRRSPNSLNWTGDFFRGSKNLMIHAAGFLALCKLTPLRWLFFAHLYRGLLFAHNIIRNYATKYNHRSTYTDLYTNEIKKHNYFVKLPDITWPNFSMFYIRGFRLKILTPFLWICDFILLIQVIFENSSKNNNINSFLIKLTLSRVVMPTFLSKYAWKILNQERAIVKLKEYYDWCGPVIGNRPWFFVLMWQQVLNNVNNHRRLR